MSPLATVTSNSHMVDLDKSIVGLQSSVDFLLCEKAQRVLFFEHVHHRHLRIQDSSCCLTLVRSLCPPVVTLKDRKGKACIYPGLKNEENEIGDFTHSEQYALFLASTCFEEFMDACVESLRATGATVASYAVLIYTHNVMCIRCAQSVIGDFMHLKGDKFHGNPRNQTDYEALSLTINRGLDQLNPGNTDIVRPAAFLAGYTHPYASVLHNFPLDHFENHMRIITGSPPTDVLSSDETMNPKSHVIMGDSEMIYHVQIKIN
jgi:hypothetical protein